MVYPNTFDVPVTKLCLFIEEDDAIMSPESSVADIGHDIQPILSEWSTLMSQKHHLR